MQQHLPSRKDTPLARQALLIAAVKIRNWIKPVAVARSLRARALNCQAHFGLVNVGPRKTRRSAQVLHCPAAAGVTGLVCGTNAPGD
jgi:hypothetical protein